MKTISTSVYLDECTLEMFEYYLEHTGIKMAEVIKSSIILYFSGGCSNDCIAKKKVKKNVRMYKETHDYVREAAEKTGKSMGDILNQALNDYLLVKTN